ncbi:MAG: glycosyltransferase family 4 protein [Armatimonadetes bacterium]|nr:glycosyltransferase family 4 protein [Armatimonadota bacterium]NOG93792.1 glycosyltransferase family 4 protein [Armatimonadota bacterium]
MSRSTGGILRDSLRVAVFSDSYTPIVNGVSISIEALVEELRARGHSVHIFTSAFPRHKDRDANVYRMRSIRTPFTRDYPLAVPPFYGTLRQFRRHTFDIIHTHTPFTVGFVGLRWAESHDLPIVSTYHTLYEKYAHYIPYFPKWYTFNKIRKHTRYYYNLCDHVIVPSEAALRSLRRNEIRTPITIIPTGIRLNPKVTQQEARLRVGARQDEKMLLYVGRIAKEKNMDVLVHAAKLILDARDDARLWIVGDGPYRAQCQMLVRNLGIGDRVLFTGFVPRSEVSQYYIASDMFVFTSMTETQGLVIGEAMAHGVPAVAVHGGGASLAVEEDVNGFVVPNSPRDFAECVLRILSNPSLHGRLSEGAKRSAKAFSMSDMCNQVLEVYESAIRQRALPTGLSTPSDELHQITH